MENLINDDLDLSSFDNESNSEFENEFDKDVNWDCILVVWWIYWYMDSLLDR